LTHFLHEEEHHEKTQAGGSDPHRYEYNDIFLARKSIGITARGSFCLAGIEISSSVSNSINNIFHFDCSFSYDWFGFGFGIIIIRISCERRKRKSERDLKFENPFDTFRYNKYGGLLDCPVDTFNHFANRVSICL